MDLVLLSRASSHIELSRRPNPSRKPRHLELVAGFLTILASFAWSPQPGASQVAGAEMPARLAVFLDCGFCNETFIRQEMTYVDWVRDRQVADVHVLVTDQNTGAGGEAQTFDVIGLGPFDEMNYSTVYTTAPTATQDEEREGFLRTLQAVLVPYIMQTPMGPLVRVDVDTSEGSGTGQMQPQEDPWDNWTFEVYADGSADFESRQQSFNARYGVYINRVTEDWKVQLRPFFNYNYDRFERNDEIIRSTSRRDGVTTYAVKSISPHWSVGGFGDVFKSTFDNVDMRYRLMPAVEWSRYPYREATRRQLTVGYRIGASHITYQDTTIYDQKQELLPQHTLAAAYQLTQPWGEIDLGMNASQYLHELERYAVRFDGSVDVRITQGLSIELGGNMAFIHNQLNLPRGDADLEEVLLRRRQLETNYEAGLSFGFRYRFGSIYNNIVNPRFGGGGGQDRF